MKIVDFFCCKYSLGCRAALPLLVTIAAFIISNIANKWCSYVYRVVEFDQNSNTVFPNNSPGPKEAYRFVSHNVGLWGYEGVEGTNYEGSTTYESERLGKCYLYDEADTSFDRYFNTARAMSILSSVLGGFTAVILAASAICPFPEFVHLILSMILLIIAAMEGLTQVVYISSFCGGGGDEYNSEGAKILVHCQASWGSMLSLGTMLIWISAAVILTKASHAKNDLESKQTEGGELDEDEFVELSSPIV